MSSNQIIEANEVREGDHIIVTRDSTFPNGVLRESRRVYEGIVTGFNGRPCEPKTSAILRAPNESAEWVGLVDTGSTTVVIERVSRAFEVGAMYRVHAVGDHEHTVRVWTREEGGWRSTSGFRADPVNSVTVGDRVVLEPQ